MALVFTDPIVRACRTGNGVEGYTIVYPFHGSLEGIGQFFHAIYHAGDGTERPLGQAGDLGAAQLICQTHYDQTHPSK